MQIGYKAIYSKMIIIVILLPLLILFYSVPLNAENIRQNVSHETLQYLREMGADLYEQLLNFKIEKDFINNGFGYSNSLNKYENWSKEVNTLKKECEKELAKLAPHKRIESELFSLCNAATNLNSLARRYATRGGQEDKYMKKMRADLEKEFKTTPNSGKVVLEKTPYSIIKDKSYKNTKRSVDVRLERRITKNQLTALAHEINNLNKKSYKRTFILYYLPGMRVDAGAWASTHFNPNLKVEILGATIEQAQKLTKPIALNNNQELIGNYFNDRGDLSCRISIFKEKGKIFKQDTYNDGSQGTQELKESRSDRGLRLDEIERNDFGEYYVINSDGNLEFWDAQGLIKTLKK